MKGKEQKRVSLPTETFQTLAGCRGVWKWVCAQCMGIHSAHSRPCCRCSTNENRQIPVHRLFVGKRIEEHQHDKIKTTKRSHNFLGPHLHCKHERPRPVSLTVVKPGNKRDQVQRPSVTARLAPLRPAFLPPARRVGPIRAALGDSPHGRAARSCPPWGPGLGSPRHHTGGKAGWLPGGHAPEPTLALLPWLVQM